MGQVYATGRKAFGFCDRCGQRYDLGDLKFQIYNLINTNFKVCPECLDEDQPQLQLGRWPVYDPQALLNPRPDTALLESRAFFGWNPLVGTLATLTLGQVTITIT